MKRNAIIRIVFWSIVIMLLSVFLYMMIAGIRFSDVSVTTVQKDPGVTAPEKDRAPSQQDDNPLPTHSTDPSMWENPDPGSNHEGNTYDPNVIRKLEILWVIGDVRILKDNVDRIIVSETGVEDPRYQMQIREKNGQLTIRYNQEEDDRILFGIHNYPKKELTVLVPGDWYCDELEVEAADANVEITELTIETMEFDGANGNCVFYETSVENLDMDTASGAISYYGKLNTLDCDAASADITAVLLNNPRSIDVDTASGNLDLTLPVDCGFTLRLDGLSTKLESEFLTTMKNNVHLHGDGRTKIEMDSMSGDMILRIGKEESVPMN